jgi:hypothetical protein
MKIIWFGILGVIVQGIGLWAFILISPSSISQIGKPAVIALFLSSIILLLWWGIRHSAGWQVLCLPVLLAIGYLVAFHALGALFKGLLRDISAPYFVYRVSLLRVFGILTLLYGFATGILVAISNTWLRQR